MKKDTIHNLMEYISLMNTSEEMINKGLGISPESDRNELDHLIMEARALRKPPVKPGKTETPQKPVELSREDWQEIYSALWSKIKSLECDIEAIGSDIDEDCNLAEWKEHLQHIQDIIGPDGRDAWNHGVKGERTAISDITEKDNMPHIIFSVDLHQLNKIIELLKPVMPNDSQATALFVKLFSAREVIFKAFPTLKP